MPDFLTPAERSKRMSLIRGKDTKPEKAMSLILSSAKLKFKPHDRALPGTPDFVLESRKVAIFVDGEFWHGKDVDTSVLSPFWRNKIHNNVQRDKRVARELRGMGWSVLRFWEKDIKSRPKWCLGRIKSKIKVKRTCTLG